MHKLKKVIKALFIILIIFLLVFVIRRFQRLYSEGKFDEALSKNKKIVYVNSTVSYENEKDNNSKDNYSDSEESQKKNSDSSSSTLQLETPTDEYYNKFNFDNVLLLYEGEQISNATIAALDRLIQDADDSLYRKPKVEFKNFSRLSKNEITPDDIEEYKNVLNEAKNVIQENSIYIFSFEYNKFNSIVDKIIITKK